MESSEVRSILVPVDFSECSKRALERAVELADRYFKATIDVLHVWDNSSRPARGAEREAQEVEALKDMERFMADVAHRGSVKIQRLHAIGAPVSKILEATRKKPYDLIVMGTRGRRKTDRDSIGSVAERVVGRAPCPVLTYCAQPAAVRS